MRRYWINETRTECYERNKEQKRIFGNVKWKIHLSLGKQYLENVPGNKTKIQRQKKEIKRIRKLGDYSKSSIIIWIDIPEWESEWVS